MQATEIARTQAVLDLYDDYAHSKLDRRQFMDRLGKFAVGGVTVAALASCLMPKYAENVTVPADDPRLESDYITYDSPRGGGQIRGLLSRPAKGKERLPGIVVVHENRGLNPYIEDVARRAALAGFVTLAPDALTPLGGYPGNDDDGREMQSKRDQQEMLEDFIAAHAHLLSLGSATGKVGVVGFCFGGWISNMMAVRLPQLGAAVPYYGRQPTDEEAAQIKAPLQLHYAALDERVNAGWPSYEAALEKYDVEHEAFFYAGVNHGFHNNTTPRYDEAAATLAWARTIAFFKQHLG